jgi:hypothetical protein
MVAHCILTKDGEVKVYYTGENTSKTENPKKISTVLETNKGREPRTSRTNSYWCGSYIQERSWKKYRKVQTKNMIDRYSPRLVEAVTEAELEREWGYLYLQNYLQDYLWNNPIQDNN